MWFLKYASGRETGTARCLLTRQAAEKISNQLFENVFDRTELPDAA